MTKFEWYEKHPNTKLLIEFAELRLGVQVRSIRHDTALLWASKRERDRPHQASAWPLSGRAQYGAFCSMGSIYKRGIIWLREDIGSGVPRETSGIDKIGVTLFAAVAHEIAHAVVGDDEVMCTSYERALARTIDAPRKLKRNLYMYSPGEEEKRVTAQLIHLGLLARPAPRHAPHVRTR